MEGFFADEAEVATSEEDSGSAEDGFNDEVRLTKKKKNKKKKRRAIVDSDEDEEDGEDLDVDLPDLIDDNPIGEDDEEGSGDEDGKRKHESEEELESELDDDDLDLIQENLGIKVQKKKKLRRIRLESDESEGEQIVEEDDRDKIAHEIFEGDDDEDMPPREAETIVPQERGQEFGDMEEEQSEESDVDDFIVDDEGQPVSQGKKKKRLVHDDVQLQEAQDIFGVDFDFEEFDQYEEYDEDEEDEDIDEYEEGEESEARPRPKKKGRRPKGVAIDKIFEPSELERGFLTDFDAEIRTADMPERFQLRRLAVRPGEEAELKEEAEWIAKHAFTTPPVSRQDFYEQDQLHMQRRYEASPVTKINKALDFIRNHQFEVPFIAFYRKEYVEPALNINDLWKVYHWDEKWMQLQTRKQNLVSLFSKMQTFQFDQIDPDKPLESHIRTLTEEDLQRAKAVETMEELRDVYQHFLLYYGRDIPRMKAAIKAKKRREREERGGGEDGENPDHDDDDDDHMLKQATRKTGYTLCVDAGLVELARKFGLTPEQFGENLRDNYQRHDVEQDPAMPKDLAEEFITTQFSTPLDVLAGARHVVAMQIAHDPIVRQCVRTTVYERAKISLFPTKKGLKEIDEAHACFTFKYIKNKLVTDLSDDQFLKIVQASDDNLLTFDLHVDDKDNTRLQPYFEEIKQLYHRDEFSDLVQEWNNNRLQAVERALTMLLFPQLLKELHSKLLDEARNHIIRSCTRKLYNWLKVAPYQADQQLEEDDDDLDGPPGLRVMGISFSIMRDTSAYAAAIDGDGEVVDFKKLEHITKRKNAWRTEDREQKEADLAKLKEFILERKPHVIGVSAETRDAVMVLEDVTQVVTELEEEHQIAPINVELLDTELATVYANSKKGEHDFRDYPTMLRQAISIARRLQDPLVEFCQLCNTDEEILCLRYHNLQDMVSKESLLDALQLEFINRVNEVGVDVNRCVLHQHTSPLVQFVCGLGPRKGYHLLKILKQNNSRLENRTLLVTMCSMGPKVFINCAGFIKIDTNALGDSTEAYVEVLDGSRVHPETYEWARKMAIDALEYEDANPSDALQEILESPERLKDLDLDAFAVELERQGYGNRHITLYDIRAELNHRYKDLRVQYRSPTAEERFNMLTKETPQTFYIGKLIMCSVSGIAHKRPHGDQLDNANPVRDDETQFWQCPFCQKNDFPELGEVWNHFDAGECPGQAVGVKTRLDNGVTGFIPIRNISDKRVTNPEERVAVGMALHCRITKIDIDRFQVELTSKSSDLADKESKWRLQKDTYYDYEGEEKEKKREEDKKNKQSRQTYVKRVIAHPSFQNIDYRTCEKTLNNMDSGEAVIRPSSKGADHLTVTWKVADGILQHIDVREEGKANDFSLGSSLVIGMEEFEDLDEIIARHIQPMVAFARDILSYKYYRDTDGGRQEILDKTLIEEKRKAPSKIPYYFSASKQFPGKFVISYLPRKTTKHEFLTVTPDGIRYRQQMFSSLGVLIKWFKEHFRDAVPGTPISSKTPMGMSSRAHATPGGSFPGGMQVAGGTPFGGFGGQYQPMGTPMMTPMMTPSQTVGNAAQNMPQHMINTPQHRITTPQYQPTPRTSQWGPGVTPRQHPGATPSRQPPSSQTPRQHPGASTPRQHPGASTPRQHPGASTPRQHPGASTQRQHPGAVTPRQHPGATTPRQPPGATTPRQYPISGSSRQPSSGMTPHHQPSGVTPRHHPSGMTPRHQPGGMTPSRHDGMSPGGGSSTPGSRTPGRSTPSRSSAGASVASGSTRGGGGGGGGSSMDWGAIAKQWMQDHSSTGSSRRTPRSMQSPGQGGGDATPLFDER